jgi:cytochrome c oxidase cbb3-type subunit III
MRLEVTKRSGNVRLLLLGLALVLAGCERGRAPGQPSEKGEVADPRQVVDFATLYATNCAGCHGVRGEGGASIGLASRGYLAVAPDAAIREAISRGRPRTAMPAFGRSAGGLLSDAQVDALVKGIRAWAPDGLETSPDAPSYLATGPGDPARGEHVFREQCGSCHRPDGRGQASVGSIVDGAYLDLVTDQYLRTTIIAGREDLGSPGWRGVIGKPLSAQDVSDTVAWLAAQRQQIPGQPYPAARLTVNKP